MKMMLILGCFSSVCVLSAQSVDGLTTGIVGYVKPTGDEMKGRLVCNVTSLGGTGYGPDGAILGESIKADEEGFRLIFFDGGRWRTVESAWTEAETIAWFDVEDGSCADDVVIPQGGSIDYVKPFGHPGATLTLTGVISQGMFQNGVGASTTSAIRMDDLSIPVKTVEKIITRVVTITNEVGVVKKDSSIKTRLLIRKKDGGVMAAKFSPTNDFDATGIEMVKFRNPKTGEQISLPIFEISEFAVDPNAPEEDRMNAKEAAEFFEKVKELYRFQRTKEIRDAEEIQKRKFAKKELREQEKREEKAEDEIKLKVESNRRTAEFIWDKFKEWPSLIWAVGAAVALNIIKIEVKNFYGKIKCLCWLKFCPFGKSLSIIAYGIYFSILKWTIALGTWFWSLIRRWHNPTGEQPTTPPPTPASNAPAAIDVDPAPNDPPSASLSDSLCALPLAPPPSPPAPTVSQQE